MTAWKITLLATQWLLLSTQPIPTGGTNWVPPLYTPYRHPLAYQEKVLPPPEFDHEYSGELEIIHKIPEDIYRICASAVRDGHRALACARAFQGNPKACTIYMMTENELARLGWDYNIILRHELGHCNGWHHDK